MDDEKSGSQTGIVVEGKPSDSDVVQWLTPATDGDVEAQLALGCHYLSLAKNEGANGPQALQAVEWLIKASRQGNEEATERLKDCQGRNIGITSENSEDVEWCVTTTVFEKETREAARKMFNFLKPIGVEGSGNLPGGELAEKTEEILMKTGQLGLEQVVPKDTFVHKTIQKFYGNVDGSSLFALDGDWDAFHEATWVTKVTHHPGMTVSWIVNEAIDAAGSQGTEWLQSLIPVNQIYTLIALLLYNSVPLSTVLWVLPLVVFFASFAYLFVVTAQMMRSGEETSQTRSMTGLLKQFSVSLDNDSAASAYCWKSATPYATFFAVLLLCVAASSVADDAWIPSPELMVLSGLACTTCFFGLSDRYDFLALCAIFIDIIMSLFPVVLEQVPGMNDVLCYLLGKGYAIDVPLTGLHLMVGLPSVAFLIIPSKFVRMLVKNSWDRTYQILIPHLVCFFWWRLTLMLYLRSTWFGLARAIVGWAGMVVLLPLLLVAALAYGAYLAVNAVSLSNLYRVVTTGALLFGASVFGMWSSNGFQFGNASNLESKSPTMRIALVLTVLIGLSVPIALVFSEPGASVPHERTVLPWSNYHEHCSGPNADLAVCAHFTGASLVGTANVSEISVVEIENFVASLAGWLPDVLYDWLRCAYGTRYPADCDSIDDASRRDICRFNTQRGRQCHMRDYDSFTYEIILSLPGSDDEEDTITLTASDWFTEAAAYIRPGHEVSIRASLPNSVLNEPTLILHWIQCNTCVDDDGTPIVLVHRSASGQMIDSLKTALLSSGNFFLQPLFSFTSIER